MLSNWAVAGQHKCIRFVLVMFGAKNIRHSPDLLFVSEALLVHTAGLFFWRKE